jgi:tetratricopeptide (TPR) repeat protein
MSNTPTTIEVFCSYVHEDQAWLQRLETHLSVLRRQGLISLWHDRLIPPGTDRTRTIDRHLETASVILLLVSADFLASDYCYSIEMKRTMEREASGEARVIPILVRPVDWSRAPFAHLQVLPINAKPLATWENQEAVLADITASIRCVIEEVSFLPASAAHEALPTIWDIPLARNPFFVGRDQELEDLHMQLQRSNTAAIGQTRAISGLGGIGKTQIAVEYAYRYFQDYQAVLWARADSNESLNSSYGRIAMLLDLLEKDTREQEIIVEAVKTWLRRHQGWLLILDNADEPSLLASFLPSIVGGHLLITTRSSDLSALGLGVGHSLEMETFSPEQGVHFLLHRANLLVPDTTLERATLQDRAVALQIVKELGGLPLGLDLAGAYIAATGTSLVAYQQIYQKHRNDLLKEHRNNSYSVSVALTWNLSFERVKARNPAGADLLCLCAFLAPDAIPEEILTKGADKLGSLLAPVAANAYLLDQAIVALRAYSLLTRNSQERTLTVHRLVQTVIGDALPIEIQHQWKQRAVLALNATIPESTFANWPTCERLLPHALHCAIWIEQEQMSTLEAARLLNCTGRYLRERARYTEAEPLFVNMLAICEQQLGSQHPYTATSLNNLAALYRVEGKYEQAEPLYQRALAIYERQLGLQHPDTAQSLNNLALLYHVQERYEQAEPLYLRALELREQLLGLQHPDTAQSLNNLALLYHVQKKNEQAEPLFIRALEIREQQLGPQHPDTAQSLNNLAEFYRTQGKYSQAEPLYKRALAIREHELGTTHPDTAGCLNNLALLYHMQGNYKQAEPLFMRALAIYEQHLGPQHPNTATCLNNLALLYRWQGKYVQAEPLYERALAIDIKTYGAEHPTIATELNNLAGLYYQQGKFTQAEPLYQRALQICKQNLGMTHPSTQKVLHNYASLLRTVERSEEAKKLEEDS